MDYREAGLLDVGTHLALYEVACFFSRPSLRLDKEEDFFSLVWEIIPKLYLLEAYAQRHAFETSGFAAWKNQSSFFVGGGGVFKCNAILFFFN